MGSGPSSLVLECLCFKTPMALQMDATESRCWATAPFRVRTWRLAPTLPPGVPMNAGESARRVAEKSRGRAERALKSAERWELGANGEAAVGAQLTQLGPEWTVIHDIAWPGRQRANIDHVVVGPTGVFVIDSKNWSGRVEIRDNRLRQNGRSRESTVASSAEAAMAVQALLPAGVTCSAALCFVRDEPLRGRSGDVIVCSTATLLDMLMTRPAALNPQQVQSADLAVRQSAQTPGTLGVKNPTSRRRLAGVASPMAASRPQRRGKTPSLGRYLVSLLCAAALIVGLNSGLLTQASQWVATQFVATVQPDKEIHSPAEKPANKRQTRQERRERRQEER